MKVLGLACFFLLLITRVYTHKKRLLIFFSALHLFLFLKKKEYQMDRLFSGALKGNVDGPANMEKEREQELEEDVSGLKAEKKRKRQGLGKEEEAEGEEEGQEDDSFFPLDKDKRILIGSYPKSISHLKSLVSSNGVSCFINLTSDKTIEEWIKGEKGVEVIYRPMLRRDQISEDGKVVNLCREIMRWLNSHPKEEKVYVHSELGYGRACIVAAILAGDLEGLQTNQAVKFVEQKRMRFRAEEETIVPTVETNIQMEQIFRMLGNPQKWSFEDDDAEGIRTMAKKEKKKVREEEDEKEGGGSGDEGGQFLDESVEKGKKGETVEKKARGVLYAEESEYIALPDRTDQGWRSEADRWIAERKKKRGQEKVKKTTASGGAKKSK